MSVHLIWDFQRKRTPEPDWIVLNSLGDWISHDARIQGALHSQSSSVAVLIHDPGLEAYLTYVRNYTGSVTEEHVDPVAALERKLGYLPDGVDAELVDKLKLDDKDIPEQGSFPDWVLAETFSTDIFLPEDLTPEQEMRVLEHLCDLPVLASHPYIRQTIRDKLSAWGHRGASVLATLEHSPVGAPYYVAKRLLLGYPQSIMNKVLQDREAIPVLPTDTSADVSYLPLPNVLALPPDFVTRIEILLHSELQGLPITQYLGTVSGALSEELVVLCERILSTPAVLNLSDIRQTFVPLIDQDRAQELEKLENEWALRQSLDFSFAAKEGEEQASVFERAAYFFTDRYLPARRALRERPDSPAREQLLAVDEQYSSWLFDNYFYLSLTENSPLAYCRVERELHRLRDEGFRIIWIVFDGMDRDIHQLLLKLLRSREAHVEKDVLPCVSAIPSITEVSMLSLVSRLPLESMFDDSMDPTDKDRLSSDYRKKLFCSHFPEGIYATVYSAVDVLSALETEAPIYCLVCPVIDMKFLHDRKLPFHQLMTYATDTLEDILRGTWQAIERNPQIQSERDRVRLVFTSDHGWTDILHSEVAAIPDNMRGSLSLRKSHHRVLIVESGQLDAGLEASLEPDWFILSGKRFGLPNSFTFLVPRKMCLVSGTGGRVHGGLSMAETMTALSVVSLSTPQWVPLTINLEAPELTNAETTTANIVIGNPNVKEVGDAILRIPDLGLRKDVGCIPTGCISLPVTLTPQRSGRCTVSGELIFQLRGAQKRQPFPLDLSIGPSEAERMVGQHRVESIFGDEE